MYFFVLLFLCVLLSKVILQWIIIKNSGKEDPPVLVGYRPLVGHLFLLLCTTTQLWKNIQKVTKIAAKQAPVVQLIILNTVVYFVNDPETAFTVSNNAEMRHYVYTFFKRWLGEGLLTAPVDVWKRHRKLMNSSFNVRVLYSFMGVFNKQAKKLACHFENEMKKGPVNVLPLIKAVSVESIYINSMGLDPEDDHKLNKQYTAAVDRTLEIITERTRKVWLHNEFVYKLSFLCREEDKIMQVLRDMTDKILCKKREMLITKSKTEKPKESTKLDTKFKGLLDLLLELSEEDCLTDAELRDELSTAVFGGYDTMSHTITYILMNLGTYKDIQEKVYQEIQVMIGDRDVDSNDLTKLIYTDAVIKETLRLYPAGPIMMRQLDKDIRIKDYTLRAGRACVINIYGLNRHSMWGEDADQFRPERWLEPGGVPDIHHAFATFGVGKRTCIGKTYAMLAIKTTLVHIIRRFKINADITKIALKIEVILTLAKPCYINMETRDKKEILS